MRLVTPRAESVSETPPRQPVAWRGLRQSKATERLRMIPSQEVEQGRGCELLAVERDETEAGACAQVTKYGGRVHASISGKVLCACRALVQTFGVAGDRGAVNDLGDPVAGNHLKHPGGERRFFAYIRTHIRVLLAKQGMRGDAKRRSGRPALNRASSPASRCHRGKR